jgi:NADPH2:quinone reductase
LIQEDLVKAVRVHEHGGPEALRYEEIERPRPGRGEALVKLAFSGVNFLDTQYRSGRAKPPQLPFVDGFEGAGTVADVGDGVSDLNEGDRVAYAMIIGTYAEYAVVPASRLVPVPASIDLDTAAAAMLQGMTAHYLTHSTYPLGPSNTVLIHAAAGGVGALIVQAARLRGATVLATVGTDEKAAIARAAGAQEVINYSRQDFEQEVRRLTNGRGVDVVYDAIGRTTFDKSLSCLRPRGYMVMFGMASGPVPPFDPASLGTRGSLFLTRPGLNQYIATREELLLRARAVFDWLSTGAMKLRIDRVLPLAQAADAHRALEGRETAGKILLRMG